MVKSCLFSDMETNTFITFDNSFFFCCNHRDLVRSEESWVDWLHRAEEIQ